MQQIFGNFVEQGNGDEYLVIHFSPTSIPLQKRWRNSGLSADFLAEYWATFFPTDDVPSQRKQAETKGAINYIANELLENVIKFCYQPANHPVSLGLYLYQNQFRFYAGNAIDPQVVEDFQTRIDKLLTEDPEKLYMEQIEKNATGESGSHLGLLTMINDYQAQLACKFEPSSDDSDVTMVTTMVQITL